MSHIGVRDNTTLVSTTANTYDYDAQIDRLASRATTRSGTTVNSYNYLVYDGRELGVPVCKS
ncbi:MAG TPA: hypothetical protein VMN36_17590 [Verrucomicrobiales bacterium]|nr:hypothetical protein [Verrucomicrobiales bacterium]